MHSVWFRLLCVCVYTVGVSILCVENGEKRFLHCQVDLPSLAYTGFIFTKEGITVSQTTSMKWITGGMHTHSLFPWPLQVSVDLDLVWEVELSLWPAISHYKPTIFKYRAPPQKCVERLHINSATASSLFAHFLHTWSLNLGESNKTCQGHIVTNCTGTQRLRI